MSNSSSVLIEDTQTLPTWGEALVWERELLAAVLSNPSAYDGLRDLVAPEDFAVSLHERLFEAIPKSLGSDGRIDRRALRAALGVYAWDAEGGIDTWLDRLQIARPVGSDPARRARDIHAFAERRRSQPDAIEIDTAAWCHQQAALLVRLAERSDPLSRQIDWPDLIEELLYVGRSQTGGVVRKMELLFEHLLKLLADPDAPSRNRWRVEIAAFRKRLQEEAKPSTRRVIDLDAAWQRGMTAAAGDLAEYAARLPRNLPQTCPFTFEELTTEALTVAALLEKLAATGDMTATERP
ncbi:DUF29 family protein [Methylorubrum sp. SB2]|uniref:DUF29 family protein n=1 Tax=Methylorubrum subtropicum TaxID=3138812 RepID=UPI00313EA24A